MVVLALLVGGLTQVTRQSQGYDANSDRSLAVQGALVAGQSNATGADVRRIIGGLQQQNRQALQTALDSAVQQSAGESARADLAAGTTPLGSVATGFSAAFADRAQAMVELRSAVDGLLGMQPIAPAGEPAAASSDTSAPAQATLLSTTQATERIAAAGTLLARSDSIYRSVRSTLASAAGHARLPNSVWVTDPQLWQPGAVAAQVDLLATAPDLAPTHYLAMRTVRLSPPALPTAQGVRSGVSVLSPTSQIGVTVVLANNGSVAEPHASVRFTLAEQSTAATAIHVESTALGLGASATLPVAIFRVKPGTSYVLTVAVILPAGQSETAGTLLEQALQVSPAT